MSMLLFCLAGKKAPSNKSKVGNCLAVTKIVNLAFHVEQIFVAYNCST